MSSASALMGGPQPPSPEVVPLRPEIEARHGTFYVGMVIFLGSWAVMFAAMFFAFLLYRVRTPVWPPVSVQFIPLWLPTLATAFIVLSSLTLEQSRRRLAAGEGTRHFAFLLQTLVLALAFLAAQLVLWFRVAGAGIGLDVDPFAAHFYMLTVFHGLHVLVGLGLLFSLTLHARRGPTPRLAIQGRLTAMFWHFVGVAWLLIYLLLFLL